ncbi:MAG TPA: hypothetical protein VGG97_24440 [Bryobacteraceae bacterium]
MKHRLALALCVFAATASAATSTAWEVNGFSDFLKGRLTNLSLSADGVLQPGPVVRWNSALDQPALWSIAAAPDGSIYTGTGHTGRLYRVAADGKPSLLWSAGQSEIFALAVDAKGVLYAGTSPSGGVYRIEGGRATEVWHSPDKYIWAIQPAADGALFIATGEHGRVYRLAPNRTASLYYETGQGNVTALALAAGHLYAGTDPNGIIYDITAPQQATILYDSSLPEIRALAVDSKGYVYAAGMGGAVASRSGAPASTTTPPSSPVVSASPTVITVTEAKTEAADADGSALKVSGDQTKSGSPAAAAGAATGTAVTEVSGVEKSAIYRIAPDRTVETLRSSKNDNVYDLLLDGDGFIFSTDDHGRVYRWNTGRVALVSEPGDGSTTRLAKSGVNLYAALSNPGRLIAFGATAAGASRYESTVHDSVSVARWGHLQWHGGGPGIAFSTRTGDSVRPDATWSKWSEPMNDPNGALIGSPAARFIQWRAEWPAGSNAHLDTVDIPYLPQNAPPVVHSISVTSIVGSNPGKSGTPAANASSAYSITVTDTGEPPAASTTTSASQSVSRLQSTQTQISWQADDPDTDKLVYSVYFRSEDGTAWQLIRSRMFENTLLLDPDVFADGRYYFKIVASDAPANSAQFARQSELISSPVLIDNTPPLVTLGGLRRDGATVDVDIEGADATSPLRLCEYSMDAGSWQPIEATDGVTDSPRERFHLHLDNVHPGEHLLVVRIYDAANNAGLARVLIR